MERIDSGLNFQEVKNSNPKAIQEDLMWLNPEILLKTYLSIWPIVLVSIAIFYFSSIVYLRYAQQEYRSSCKVLLKDEKSSGQITEAAILKEIGLTNSTRNMDNEVEIIQTRMLMEQVIEKLGLDITYYGIGKVKTREFYNDMPLAVTNWIPKDTLKKGRDLDLEFRWDGGNFIWIEDENEEIKANIKEPIIFSKGILELRLMPNYNLDKSKKEDELLKLWIKIRSKERMAYKYIQGLTFGELSKKRHGTYLKLQ